MSWLDEVKNGDRFGFGKNWSNFLENLSDEQIENAKRELIKWLGGDNLNGKTFLDIGCGSGLHSLAARMLGASVYSFDYDLESVECAKYLKNKYFENDDNWKIEQGDVLDEKYLVKLGKFDIVYSWGVLHHTGDMWKALKNVIIPLKQNGILFIAIYNTQVYWTKYWKFVKRTYNKSLIWRVFWISFYFTFNTLKGGIKDILLLKNPLSRYKEYKQNRGMSLYHDLIDWLGGYPFETAKPEEMFDFYHSRGFELKKLYTANGGIACNQFVFKRV